MAGFTIVRNVGAGSFGDVALRDAINDGDIPGPRMLVSGPPIGITGGHCSGNNLLPPEYGISGEGVADGPWPARTVVRTNSKYAADLIKTCSTGGVMSKDTKVVAPRFAALHDEGRKEGPQRLTIDTTKLMLLFGTPIAALVPFLRTLLWVSSERASTAVG